MYDIGKHFHLESQGRNPALAFAAILMIFGAFATLSHRTGSEAWITKQIGTPCLLLLLLQMYKSYLVLCLTNSHSSRCFEKLIALPYCPCLRGTYSYNACYRSIAPQQYHCKATAVPRHLLPDRRQLCRGQEPCRTVL